MAILVISVSLDSSSKASSDFHSDASSDSSLRHTFSDHSSPDLPSTSPRPSCKRHRSAMTSVPALPPISGALSPVHANLIPSPKRVRDSGYLVDIEVDPRETNLKDDVMVRGINARVVDEAVNQKESETGMRGPVEREQGRRIVGVESAITALTERIAELERDNRRLRGTTSVENPYFAVTLFEGVTDWHQEPRGADEEPANAGSPGVIVYGYDRLPMHLVALPSPDYTHGPEHPPSPDYVPGLEHPPSLVYVPEPAYPEYLVSSEDEALIKDQPLPANALPTALFPSYPFDDNDDDDDDMDDEDEEASKDKDDDEEEEHLAPVDFFVVPVVDHVPSAGDTKAFETAESSPTPESPKIVVLPSHTQLHRAQNTPFPFEVEVARLLALPTPPPSPLTPLSSLLPQITSSPLHVPSPPLPLPSHTIDGPTYTEASPGYREANAAIEESLFTTLASRFKVGESSAAGATGPPSLDVVIMDSTAGFPMSREVGYMITNTWDEIAEAMLEIALTTLEGVY
nr:hypothetical protein [Tanacetum cinerariifolium]